MSRDSIGNILRVSILLCLVCSIAVSLAAVGLKNRQVRNKRLDQQKNILLATGNYRSEELTPKTVDREFDENVELRYIDLETGDEVPASALPGGASYDPRAATGDPELRVTIPADVASRLGLRFRAPYYPVYVVQKDGQFDTLVLPIVGKGLWSTMYGFLALEPDLTTVRGINYYEHGETPGLGGEVDNPRWKAQWVGKTAFKDGQPAIEVVKGSAGDDPHKIDGLAGATITSNGVEHMVDYWLGEGGFGKYVEKQRDARHAEGTGTPGAVRES